MTQEYVVKSPFTHWLTLVSKGVQIIWHYIILPLWNTTEMIFVCYLLFVCFLYAFWFLFDCFLFVNCWKVIFLDHCLFLFLSEGLFKSKAFENKCRRFIDSFNTFQNIYDFWINLNCSRLIWPNTLASTVCEKKAMYVC